MEAQVELASVAGRALEAGVALWAIARFQVVGGQHKVTRLPDPRSE